MFWMWAGFVAFVFVLLAVDVYLFHRRSHVVGVKEALIESCIWVALAIVFSGFIYLAYENHWQGLGLRGLHHPRGAGGGHAVVLFATGYLIEESLSVDNLFVMTVVFAYFAIPAKFQHRVLFWGIIGTQAMRGTMICMGAALISRFEWVLYVFGIFLLYTAWKMLRHHANPKPKSFLLLRAARRVFPVTNELHGPHFMVRQQDVESRNAGSVAVDSRSNVAVAATTFAVTRWVLTPLALALLMVETTDLLFAVDSIPATFAITTDPFLVFTSNIFAVLGLRAMYFALAGVLKKFKYLSVSLAAILAVVGLKMLARPWISGIHHASWWVLGVVILFLAAGVVASLIAARCKARIGPGDSP